MAATPVDLELGNITLRQSNLALDAIASRADTLELSIGPSHSIVQKASLYPGQKMKGVSAIFGPKVGARHGMFRRLNKGDLWDAIATTIDSMLSAAALDEWVVLNEVFAVAPWIAERMGGVRSLLIDSYSYAQDVAPNSRLALRDLFAAPWVEILVALADPACKRLIQSVEVQVRCDLGWPPKLPVSTSQTTVRLGWHLKRSRFFRAMRVAQLRELVAAIQGLGYQAVLAECTAWVGPSPSPALLRGQGKLYESWLQLAQEAECRISWWDWHDGFMGLHRQEGIDYPGLWTADGHAKHPSVVGRWNLS